MAYQILHILALFALTTICQGYIQEFHLHRNANLNDSYFVYKESVNDLPINIGELQAFCTKGFWVVYEDKEFEGASRNIHAQDDTLYCLDQPFTYKSFRHGAQLDTAKDGISIFPEEGYQGEEQLFDRPAISELNGKSVLYSGTAEWLLFEQQNFKPPSACVSIQTDYIQLGIGGHVNVTQSLGLAQVGSFYKGCTKRDQARYQREYYEQVRLGFA